MIQHNVICSMIENELKKHSLSLETDDLKTFYTDPNSITLRTVSSGRILNGTGGLHYSEYLYHHYLTKEQKRKIFVSSYEIGHPDPIPDRLEKSLFAYLHKKYGGGDVEGVVKRIKKQISALTNIPFKNFLNQDRNIAYKVLTLFYRVSQQHKSQLFTFLRKEDEQKAEFEFRSSYPSELDNACQNSAIIAELLSSLSFSMPLNEWTTAQQISANLAEAGNIISERIQDEIKKESQSLEYSPKDIYVKLKQLLPEAMQKSNCDNNQLLFRLYAALTLQEYSFRSKSNEILAKSVYSHPIKMKTLYRARLKTFNDEDVLPYLLGHKIPRKRSELDLKAKFIKKIILSYAPINSELRKRFPKMNFQIIKAMILHDEKLNIKIPSKVKGIGNTPNSVTSILKNAVKYSKKNSNSLPPLTLYPEALVLYWQIRYHLICNALFSKNMETVINNYCKKSELNRIVDIELLNYFSFQGSSTFENMSILSGEK